MSAYEEPEEGEWVQPIERGYKMCCCDCGLVHNVDFRVRKGRAQRRMFNGANPRYGRWLDWYFETYYVHALGWLQ